MPRGVDLSLPRYCTVYLPMGFIPLTAEGQGWHSLAELGACPSWPTYH